MALNSYGSSGDSFLYDCDEVPFDEIPPEPGREIKDSGFGELVIRVQKDPAEEVDNYLSDDDSSNLTSSRYVGPLQRTIHQSRDRIVHEPESTRDYDHQDYHHDTYNEGSRKRRYISPEKDRGSYVREISRARPLSSDEGYHESDHHDFNSQPHRVPSSSYHDHGEYDQIAIPVQNEPSFRGNQIKRIRKKPDLRQHKPNPYSNRGDEAQKIGPHKLVVQNERSYYHGQDNRAPQDSIRHAVSTSAGNSHAVRQPLLNNIQTKRAHPVSKPNSKPLSERLGPPVRKAVPSQKLPPPISRTTNPSKKPTNFIKRNIASSSVAKNKQVAPRPTTRTGPPIKKVASHNPISKAKQKAGPKKTNLQKNIALLTNAGNKNNTAAAGLLSPVAGPSKGPNAIADLIHGILSEPDVKEMITTIAQQSLPDEEAPLELIANLPPKPVLNLLPDPVLNLPSNPPPRPQALDVDVKQTLDRANQLLNDNFKGIDATSFKTNRQIPTPKTKYVKVSQYCKECRLEFPSTIMRDLHYKTEMHCFVNGDWWKFNPKPPTRISKNKFPISVFCILCWDIVRAQTDETLTSHNTSKRHRTNKSKFQEIFGRLPLYDWCMWEELSLNFRNCFVPVPPQLRNVMHPEYFYDQRVHKR